MPGNGSIWQHLTVFGSENGEKKILIRFDKFLAGKKGVGHFGTFWDLFRGKKSASDYLDDERPGAEPSCKGRQEGHERNRRTMFGMMAWQ